jgi:hypothetical protein
MCGRVRCSCATAPKWFCYTEKKCAARLPIVVSYIGGKKEREPKQSIGAIRPTVRSAVRIFMQTRGASCLRINTCDTLATRFHIFLHLSTKCFFRSRTDTIIPVNMPL